MLLTIAVLFIFFNYDGDATVLLQLVSWKTTVYHGEEILPFKTEVKLN